MTTTTSVEKSPVILSSYSNWHNWIFLIRTTAKQSHIWDLVNPDIEEKPVCLHRPDFLRRLHDQDQIDYENDKDVWKIEYLEWEKQEKALQHLTKVIQSSITESVLEVLQLCEDTDPWSLLHKLKEEYCPSDIQAEVEVEHLWQKQLQGPSSQNVDQWLLQWEKVSRRAISLGIYTRTDKKPQRDFLLSLRGLHPQFVTSNLIDMSRGKDIGTLGQLVADFRRIYTMEKLHKTPKGSTHSAFSTVSASSETQNSSLKRKQQKQAPMCLCGSQHWYNECNYLNPSVRPQGWCANQQIKQAIDQKLASNAPLRSRIDASITRDQRIKAKAATTSSNGLDSNILGNGQPVIVNTCITGFANQQPQSAIQQTCDEPTVINTLVSSAYTTMAGNINGSWILDSGATDHVCNAAMASRYRKTRDALPGQIIYCGNSSLPIQSYGEVDINVQQNGRTVIIRLTNVCYVPSMLTSIVSLRRFNDSNIHWDTKQRRIYQEDRTICSVNLKHGHYLMEDNTGVSDASFVPTAVLHAVVPRSTDEWHNLMGHPNIQAVRKMPSNTKGCQLTDQRELHPTQKPLCETCELSKPKHLVSRSTFVEHEAVNPFERISYDMLIVTTPAYNGNRYVTHIECTETDFIMLETHSNKYDTGFTLQSTISFIINHFKRPVKFLRLDNESSITGEQKRWIKAQGITVEFTAPYTPAQNGHSERLGGVVTHRARALKIKANLPHSVWPELYKTAAYLLNRTPRRKLKWKTPFEAVFGYQPALFHLKIVGCKAYMYDNNAQKGHKLDEKAHIGYLMGYESTNIFRIWLPAQKKVARTRDVRFDETAFYKAHEEPRPQTITVPTFPQLAELDSSEDVWMQPLREGETWLGRVRRLQDGLEIDPPPQTAAPIAPAAPAAQTVPTPPQEATPQPSAGPPAQHQQPEEQFYEAFEPVSPPTTTGTDDQQAENENENRSRSPAIINPNIPSPASTSEPTATQLPSTESSVSSPAPQPLSADLSEHHILSGTRTRRPRRQAYFASLQDEQTGEEVGFHQAFAAYTQIQRPLSQPELELRQNLPPEPAHYKELLAHPHRQQFENAMRIELETLTDKQTWRLIDAHKATKRVVPLTWVYKYKVNDKGEVVKHKARLCVRGDLQSTQQETYAATLAFKHFRLLMGLVASRDLNATQMDAVNAFVNSRVKEPTFCTVPPGAPLIYTPDQLDNKVLMLEKALYGLKEAPNLWQEDLTNTLKDLGLRQMPEVPCIWYNNKLIFFFFVDDMVTINEPNYEAYAKEFRDKLCQRYEIKVIGDLKWFLSVQIIRDRVTRRLWLNQAQYLSDIYRKFITNPGRTPSTPLPLGDLVANDGKATPQEVHIYQQKVGSINFPAVFTRADTSYPASRLSAFLQNPSVTHQELACRVIEYLYHSRYLSLLFDGNVPPQMIVASDASFGTDTDDRKSIQGFLFKLYGSVDWKSTKQPTVTTSSTEAELLALSDTAKHALWWMRTLQPIHPIEHITIREDNEQTIRLIVKPYEKLNTKLRHVDIHHHWLRQEIGENKPLSLQWVPSAENEADGFTKALPPQKHAIFLQQLGLCYIPGAISQFR